MCLNRVSLLKTIKVVLFLLVEQIWNEMNWDELIWQEIYHILLLHESNLFYEVYHSGMYINIDINMISSLALNFFETPSLHRLLVCLMGWYGLVDYKFLTEKRPYFKPDRKTTSSELGSNKRELATPNSSMPFSIHICFIYNIHMIYRYYVCLYI